jgi:hypothetical protein
VQCVATRTEIRYVFAAGPGHIEPTRDNTTRGSRSVLRSFLPRQMTTDEIIGAMPGPLSATWSSTIGVG